MAGDRIETHNHYTDYCHGTAVAAAAARAGDKTAAIGRFQGMIDGCFGCHTAYKDRVANVLQLAE